MAPLPELVGIFCCSGQRQHHPLSYLMKITKNGCSHTWPPSPLEFPTSRCHQDKLADSKLTLHQCVCRAGRARKHVSLCVMCIFAKSLLCLNRIYLHLPRIYPSARKNDKEYGCECPLFCLILFIILFISLCEIRAWCSWHYGFYLLVRMTNSTCRMLPPSLLSKLAFPQHICLNWRKDNFV